MSKQAILKEKKVKDSHDYKAKFITPFSEIAWSDSYMSLLLGIIVVFFAGFLLFSFIKGRKLAMMKATSSATTKREEQYSKDLHLPEKYTVTVGDDLSQISQKFYNSSVYAVDIAKQNNISNPDYLPAGTVLVLPKISEQQQKAGDIASAITGTSYTVLEGDYIWEIAERAYGNGNKAIDIINANTLGDPNNISAGTVLKIPR